MLLVEYCLITVAVHGSPLVPYFEKHYNRLDEADRKRFQKLLDQSDVELFEWFTRRSTPENNELEKIEKLRF